MQEMGLQSITRYSKRDHQKGKRLAKNRIFCKDSSKQMIQTLPGAVMWPCFMIQ